MIERFSDHGELLLLVHERFSDHDELLFDVLERFSDHSERFFNVLERFLDYGERFFNVLERFLDHGERLLLVHERFQDHGERLLLVHERFSDHGERFFDVLERFSDHDERFFNVLEQFSDYGERLLLVHERFLDHGELLFDVIERFSDHGERFFNVIERFLDHGELLFDVIERFSDHGELLLLVHERFSDHDELLFDVLERFFNVLERFPTCGSDFLMIEMCSLNLFFQIDILTIQVIINGEGWLMMGQQIKGKTAYITGAGSGIGRATALALAKEGVHVGFIARTESKLEAVAREVETYGVNTSYAVANIAKLEEVEEAVAKLETSLGSADILINNAGIGAYGDFLEMDPETWKQTIEVNVFGTYHVTRAVLPHMLKKNQGDIIMISSSNGLKGTAGSTSYSASKFAIQGMSEALMQEVRRNNIRVFTLNPSLVATELAFGEKLAEKNDDKYMQPEDLAEYMVAQLKLHPRMFIKQSLQWATNPF